MLAPTPRTTPILVEGIISVQAGTDLTPFITTANMMVTTYCSNSGYSDGYVGSQMELIERWLSAHYYTVFDNQLTAAKAGTVSVAYQNRIDFSLKSSIYGQQVLLLDGAGNLAAIQNTAQVKRKIVPVILYGGRRCRRFGDVDGDDWADLTVES